MKAYFNYNEIEIGHRYRPQFITIKKKRLKNVPFEELKKTNIATLEHILSANEGVFQSAEQLYDVIPLFSDLI